MMMRTKGFYGLAFLAVILGMAGCGGSTESEVRMESMRTGPSFEDDLDFLREHKEVIVLSDESGQAQVLVVPDYQGRVMTSTARGDANRIAVSSLAAGRARAQDTLNRGIAFWNSDNVEDAVRQFREALETDVTLVESYYWLGLAYEAGGDPDAATQALSRYLGAAPSGVHADEARRRLAVIAR